MAASMRCRISCSRSRARSRYRSRPTSSSRTAEGAAMAPRTMAFRTMPARTMARKTVRGTARTGRNSSERLAALYLDMLAAERGAGKNTLAAYGRDLADFSDYLASAGSTIATASAYDLRIYLGDLAGRGLQSSTVARRLSAIRQLYRFLYTEGQRKDDPAAALEG